MIVHPPEWFKFRLGKATSSRVADATSNPRTKGGVSLTRKAYKDQLVAERITGISHAPDLSRLPQIRWGAKHEPDAIALFEYLHDIEVTPIKTTNHPRIAMAAASPDGMMMGGGVLECKAPNTITHMGYIKDGIVPVVYRKQMLWEMACTGEEWGKFISYDPRMESYSNKLFVVVFEPPVSEINELEEQVQEFLHEVAVEVNWFNERNDVCL